LDRILASLIRLNTLGQLPDLSVITGFQRHDSKDDKLPKTATFAGGGNNPFPTHQE
jgi:hypothetical protein